MNLYSIRPQTKIVTPKPNSHRSTIRSLHPSAESDTGRSQDLPPTLGATFDPPFFTPPIFLPLSMLLPQNAILQSSTILTAKHAPHVACTEGNIEGQHDQLRRLPSHDSYSMWLAHGYRTVEAMLCSRRVVGLYDKLYWRWICGKVATCRY
jgi:hypothetical protein